MTTIIKRTLKSYTRGPYQWPDTIADLNWIRAWDAGSDVLTVTDEEFVALAAGPFGSADEALARTEGVLRLVARVRRQLGLSAGLCLDEQGTLEVPAAPATRSEFAPSDIPRGNGAGRAETPIVPGVAVRIEAGAFREEGVQACIVNLWEGL